MSIFDQEPNVRKDSWHYKMLDKVYDDYDKPKTQCSYFWVVLFMVITYPLWIIGYKLEGNHGGSVWKYIGVTVFGFLLVIFGIYALVGFFFLCDILFNGGGLFNSLYVIDTTADTLYKDTNMTSLGQVIFGMVVIEFLVMIAGLGYGAYKLARTGIEFLESKYKEKKRKKDNSLTFVGSFVGMVKDRKNKICKPIKYVEEDGEL